MRYLLDTNVVIAILKDSDSRPARKVRQCLPSEVGVSSIVIHELYFGAFKSQRKSHNLAVVDGLHFQVLDLDKEDARAAGEIRAQLSEQGTPIGPFDILIAGQALARSLILVTHNLREFERIPKLTVEDWLAQ